MPNLIDDLSVLTEDDIERIEKVTMRWLFQAVVDYHYTQDPSHHYMLHQATLCAIPSGLLQDRYNPSPDDTIWLAGPHAPKRGEEFRVRLGFKRLSQKALWRVQRVRYGAGVFKAAWQE